MDGPPLGAIVKLSSGPKIQDKYKSAERQTQFSVYRNQNLDERYILPTDCADESPASIPRGSARGQPVSRPIASPHTQTAAHSAVANSAATTET